MLRSFPHAAATAMRQMAELQPASQSVLAERGKSWHRQASDAILTRDRTGMAGVPSLAADPAITGVLPLIEQREPPHADA
jgi:hypothetical protein